MKPVQGVVIRLAVKQAPPRVCSRNTPRETANLIEGTYRCTATRALKRRAKMTVCEIAANSFQRVGVTVITIYYVDVFAV